MSIDEIRFVYVSLHATCHVAYNFSEEARQQRHRGRS